MALGGDLKNINLADIFQTLSMNQQVGTLVVRSEVKEKRIYFSGHGVSLVSGRTIPGFRLGRYLVGSGRITEDDLRAALAEQRHGGELLGKVLTSRGYCTPADVEEVIRYHAAEELYEIFTWKEGEFQFLEGTSSDNLDRPSPYALVQFDAGGLVMEAAHRLDEFSRFRDMIPDDGDFLVRTGTSGEKLDPSRADPDLAGVYALVDGTKSVRDIVADYHLAAFDTCLLLRDLVSEGHIRLASFAELTATAWEFVDRKDHVKAVRCFERAHLLEPRDVPILKQLIACYEQLEEKRVAAVKLVRLGTIYLEAGKPDDAIPVLELAEKYDPGCIEAPTTLLRAHQIRGDSAVVSEKARVAATLLSDRQEFERAIEICRSGLAAVPGHAGLRVILANAYLGSGQRDLALEELENLAASYEESRNFRRLEEIYKKILQLDSSRREYLRRLQEMKAGVLRRRQRLLRAGAIGGGVLVVLLLSLTIFTGGGGAEDKLQQARELVAQRDFSAAEALANEIVLADPDSELAFEARGILFDIGRLRDPQSSEFTQAEGVLVDRIEGWFRKAADLIAADKFENYQPALDQLLQLSEFFRGDEFSELATRAGPGAGKKCIEEYRISIQAQLNAIADKLEATGGLVRGELGPLEEVKFGKVDLAAVRETVTKAQALRELAEPQPRHRLLAMAEAIELATGDGTRAVTERFEKISENLDQLHDRASQVYHSGQALLRKDELRTAFDQCRELVSDMNNSGRLTEAIATCERFLARCDELRDEQPEAFYAPVAKELLGESGLNLDGNIKADLASIKGVLAAIDRAEGLVHDGRFEDANTVLRDLIRQNFRIDFRDLVRLCLHVRTRPIGARVRMSWNGQAPVEIGTVTPDGLLVRYPPYGATRVDVEMDTFESEHFDIADFNDVVPATPLKLLRKRPDWTWSGAGPLQARATVWNDSLVIPSRDGKVRILGPGDGVLGFEVDTRQLSGIGAPALINGGKAYLASLDGGLLMIDLDTREPLWSAPTAERLRTAPVLVGDLVIVADEGGTVYAFREGKEVWRRSLTGRVQADPVATRDAVYFATTEGQVVRLSPATGEVVWSRTPGGRVYANLEVGPFGDLYVGTDGSEVFRLSTEDGSQRWKAVTDNAVRGRISVDEGRILAATLSGSVYIIMLETGEEIGRVPVSTGNAIEGGVTAGDGRLYVVDSRGILYAMTFEHGLEWTYNLGSKSLSPPLRFGGRVFAVTEAGQVFAFRE